MAKIRTIINQPRDLVRIPCLNSEGERSIIYDTQDNPDNIDGSTGMNDVIDSLNFLNEVGQPFTVSGVFNNDFHRPYVGYSYQGYGLQTVKEQSAFFQDIEVEIAAGQDSFSLIYGFRLDFKPPDGNTNVGFILLRPGQFAHSLVTITTDLGFPGLAPTKLVTANIKKWDSTVGAIPSNYQSPDEQTIKLTFRVVIEKETPLLSRSFGAPYEDGCLDACLRFYKDCP